jgi:hypothetical protein
VQLELEAKRLQKNAVTRSVKSRDVELMREKKQLRALRGVGEA